MMETVVGVSKQQPYSPHLKKVLKTYQLSAVKSLQGPSTLLGTPVGMDKGIPSTASSPVTLVPKKEPVPPEVLKVVPPVTSAPLSDCGGEVFVTPPPFPIQQLPILTTPDQSRSELSETVLEGETISCFVVGGEKRLCLPQVLNSVLRDFSLCQINQVCEELQIYCSRCNPEQLEVLKVTGILPMTAPSCGLITKTDAERLTSALLHRSGGIPVVKAPSGGLKGALSFKVYHECFGKCKGICTPELYTDNNAHCIECVECHGMFSPQKFVCHVHRYLENRTCHWGFDSNNWRSYLLIAKDQDEHEKLAKVLDEFKEQHENTARNSQHNKRKQIQQPEPDPHELQVLKKPKLEASAEPYGASYLYPVTDPSNHILWYESWARMSAFRPWPSILTKEGKGQPPPPPVMRESLSTSVPSYLSHSPPMLLHPERVVPMSESERYERTYQPNVALAPNPQQHRSRIDTAKLEVKLEDMGSEIEEKKPVCSKKSSSSPVSHSSGVPVAPEAHSITATTASTATPATAATTAGGPTLYNPEIELSTDTDDSSSDVTGEPASARRESKSLVEEVVAVLGNLDDARDAARDRVVKIVEDLALRLEEQESKMQLLQEENEELRRLCHESGIPLQRFSRQIEPQHVTELHCPIKQEPNVTCGTHGMRSRAPSCSGGSPVSVITSPPPVIKSEPASSE